MAVVERRPYAALDGLQRAMTILETLADSPLRPTQVAERLGLSFTTVHRTLQFLHRQGYVEKDPWGAYCIGARLYYIGSSYVENLPVLQAARPHLGAVARETQATAQLVQRNERRSMVIAVFEPDDEHIPKTSIGYHFPLHCGAKGHVLLAFAEPDFVEDYLAGPLEALTAHSITDPDTLRGALAAVLRDGYAVTERDVQISTGAVAAPVRDAGGGVIASVTLITGHARFRDQQASFVDAVVESAEAISKLLGWHPSRSR